MLLYLLHPVPDLEAEAVDLQLGLAVITDETHSYPAPGASANPGPARYLVSTSLNTNEIEPFHLHRIVITGLIITGIFKLSLVGASNDCLHEAPVSV